MDDAYSEKERFLRIMNKKPVDRASLACPLQTATVPLMEKTGACWPNANQEAEPMAELAVAAHDIAGLESVRLPFCLTVEAEALGCPILPGSRISQPSVSAPVVCDYSDIEKLTVPDPAVTARMPAVQEAIGIARDKVGEDVPIIAGITAPFTLAGHIRGVETMLLDMFDNPDFVKDLIIFATDVAKEYSKALVDAGADAITLIEPSATCELIGPSDFEQYAAPTIGALSKSIKVPTILHICGNTTPILPTLETLDVDAVSIDHVVDVRDAHNTFKDTVLVGNVNPVDVLLFGTPQDVEAESLKCLDAGVDILAPGCGFSPNTPLENMKTFASCKHHQR